MEKNFDKRDYNAVVRIQEQADKIMERMRERAIKNNEQWGDKYGRDYELKHDPIYLALEAILCECETIVELNY